MLRNSVSNYGVGWGAYTKGGCAKSCIDSCIKAQIRNNIVYKPSVGALYIHIYIYIYIYIFRCHHVLLAPLSGGEAHRLRDDVRAPSCHRRPRRSRLGSNY